MIIIGYGSLMDPASAIATMPSLTGHSAGYIVGFRRCFNLVSIGGIMRGEADFATNEVAAVAAYATSSDLDILHVGYFEIPEAELVHYKGREERYQFIHDVKLYTMKGKLVEGANIMCIESCDEVYFRSKDREAAAAIRATYDGKLWGRRDVYPLRSYLHKCLSAAFTLGGLQSLHNFITTSYLCDRVTTIHDYLLHLFPNRLCGGEMKALLVAASSVHVKGLLQSEAVTDFDLNNYLDIAIDTGINKQHNGVQFSDAALIINSAIPPLVYSLASFSDPRVAVDTALATLIALSSPSCPAQVSNMLDMHYTGVTKHIGNYLASWCSTGIKIASSRVSGGGDLEGKGLSNAAVFSLKRLEQVLSLTVNLISDVDIALEIGMRGVHKALLTLSMNTAFMSDEVAALVDDAIYYATRNIPKGYSFPIKNVDLNYMASPPKVMTFSVFHSTLRQRVTVRLKPIREHMPGHFATGFKLWGGSVILGRYILYNSDLFRGKSVLEIGSGLGFPGICSLLCSPAAVTMSDYLPKVVKNLRYNLDINREVIRAANSSPFYVGDVTTNTAAAPPVAKVVTYDWDELIESDDGSGYKIVTEVSNQKQQDVELVNEYRDAFNSTASIYTDRPAGKHDIVIAADVVASVELAYKVGHSMKYWLSKSPLSLGIMASADGFSRFGMGEFPEVMKELGMDVEVQRADDRYLEGVEDAHTFNLYFIRWRGI